MIRALLAPLLLAALLPACAEAPALRSADPAPPVPLRPVHTYSIVARDPVTGDLGVAVQSHWFNVGSVVPWAEPGVGAVATQSFVEPSYGALGLELMRAGKPAPDALKALLSADADREVRQVAMVDAKGRVAAHTGNKCIAAAGHEAGEGFSVQANLMDKPTVWPAMARAFRSKKGDLAERMIAAMRAAEGEGGDIRGKQSAALVIVRAQASGQPWNDRLFDLRVEDHPDPVGELERLVKLRRAYRHMDEGDGHVTAGRWEAARKSYAEAAKLAPGIVEMPFWQAVALASQGKRDEALPLFKAVFAKEPVYKRLVPRLVDVGQLPKDPKLIEAIVAQ